MPSSTDLWSCIYTVAVLTLLTGAALHDICFRTLPDSISVALIVGGIAQHLLTGDLALAIAASLAVFGVTLLAWRFHMLGGGDVKIIGASTLALPLAAVPEFVIATTIAGGILAILFLALRPFVPARPGPRPAHLFARVVRAEARRIRRRGPLPYAVAIAAGAATALVVG